MPVASAGWRVLLTVCAGGSVLDVPPFGLATSHLVLYSDGGFAGSCTVKLLVATREPRQPDAGLAAAPMSYCICDVGPSCPKSNRHKTRRLAPLPERLHSENQHIRTLLGLLGARSPSLLLPFVQVLTAGRQSSTRIKRPHEDPKRVHEASFTSRKSDHGAGELPGQMWLHRTWAFGRRADDTRAWSGGCWAMACQPSAVEGSAAASGQHVVITGEGWLSIDVEVSTRI
jgi:hypothetical protein